VTAAAEQQSFPSQTIRAPRGAEISCKGWPQEAVLRLLLNCLDPEVAERPQVLLISGTTGSAAADWPSFHAIVESLRTVEEDQSLRIQAGRCVGVSRASRETPRVIARSAGGPAGPTIYGNWLYAGPQTALPVLYEIYAAVARRQFAGSLVGRLVVGGGMGGAAGARPLAAALNGAAFLGIDPDPERIKTCVKSGYCEAMINQLDEALRILKNAVRQRKPVSIGLIGSCENVFPELARRGVVPDVLSDNTPELRHSDQDRSLQALNHLGTRIIDPAQSLDCLRPLVDDGNCLATWMALSGDRGDLETVDQLAINLFPEEERPQRWLPIAAKYVRYQGLPARVTWFKKTNLARLGRAINEHVAAHKTTAPILLGFHSKAPESSESAAENSPDGSCWSWDSGAVDAGPSIYPTAARAIVADGTAEAARYLNNWPAG
jgi:urocanate hydratase